MEDKTDKGFTVKDKRIFVQDDAEKKQDDTAAQNSTRQDISDGTASEKTGHDASPPLPEINFSSFIISLSSSALFHFGEIPDPLMNKKQRNLPLAKQTIDILGILKLKTAGNLSKEESQLLENLLYDLRIRYVEETKKEGIN
jgi:hypothetical protein